MQSVTSATSVATTARANDTTLFASLELSKSKWVVTINSPGSEKFSKHVVEGGDGAGLLDLLSRSRAKADQRLQGDEEFAGQRDDGDPADPSLRGADPRLKPAAQRRVRLVTQPEPGKLDHGLAQ